MSQEFEDSTTVPAGVDETRALSLYRAMSRRPLHVQDRVLASSIFRCLHGYVRPAMLRIQLLHTLLMELAFPSHAAPSPSPSPSPSTSFSPESLGVQESPSGPVRLSLRRVVAEMPFSTYLMMVGAPEDLPGIANLQLCNSGLKLCELPIETRDFIFKVCGKEREREREKGDALSEQ